VKGGAGEKDACAGGGYEETNSTPSEKGTLTKRIGGTSEKGLREQKTCEGPPKRGGRQRTVITIKETTAKRRDASES